MTGPTGPLPHYLRRSGIKSVIDQRSWRGSEVSAAAVALFQAGSPVRPWRGAASEPGYCAPAAAVCSLERLAGALQKNYQKILLEKFLDEKQNEREDKIKTIIKTEQKNESRKRLFFVRGRTSSEPPSEKTFIKL